MKRNFEPGDLVHAGAGTSQIVVFLSLIPGFIPALALTAVVTVILVAPLVILGLATVLLAAPFYLASRAVRRARRRRRRERHPATVRTLPIPAPHVS